MNLDTVCMGKLNAETSMADQVNLVILRKSMYSSMNTLIYRNLQLVSLIGMRSIALE